MAKLNQVVLTKEGIKELKLELDKLITKVRPKVINELKAARAQGDLSENAEYDAARANQAITEGRISKIESLLKNVKVFKTNKTLQDQVKISDWVTIYNHNLKETSKIRILGPLETNPFKNIISSASPIGKALLGHKLGSTVSVKTPKQTYMLTIKKIN